jgi:hypothetical protein
MPVKSTRFALGQSSKRKFSFLGDFLLFIRAILSDLARRHTAWR